MVSLALTLEERGEAVTPVPFVHELGRDWMVGADVKVRSAH